MRRNLIRTPVPVHNVARHVFNAIGCALCHTPTMQTAPVMNSAVLEYRPVNLFSDLLVHHMGAGLADDVIQGAAGPDEFRSAPLWGVGQRLFFLHDGRTSDLLVAIKAHSSGKTKDYPPSEANAVIDNFRDLCDNGPAGGPRFPALALTPFLREIRWPDRGPPFEVDPKGAPGRLACSRGYRRLELRVSLVRRLGRHHRYSHD